MEFFKRGQGRRLKILKSIYSKYWEWGFKSRLYDLLSPQAYLDSLARLAHYCDLEAGQLLLDAGCGSGSLLPFLEKKLKGGGRYLGMDVLNSGFSGLIGRAEQLGFGDRIDLICCDFSSDLALKGNSVDVVVAHFSLRYRTFFACQACVVVVGGHSRVTRACDHTNLLCLQSLVRFSQVARSIFSTSIAE